MKTIINSILSITVALTIFAANTSAAGDQRYRFSNFGYEQQDDGLIRLHFTQRGFDDGGQIHVKMWGRDLNQDGVLYSMSGLLAAILPGPMAMGPGNEFIRVEVEFINFFGIPRFKQVFDERETPLVQFPAPDPTMFFGFSYNLDGGMMGDDPNEGFSFSPLAPAVVYTMGELFQSLLGPGFTELFSCGEADTVCAAVLQLRAIPEPPGFELVNEAYSNDTIKVHRSNRHLPDAAL